VSIEAQLIYTEWTDTTGQVLPEILAIELIGWVLRLERRHQTAGHRQTPVTDEAYLTQLGYTHRRDGSWHLDG
jgi:hypothetical protein